MALIPQVQVFCYLLSSVLSKMLVPNTIKLCIINPQGKRCTLTVEPTAGIHFIKRRAIEAVYESECAGQEAQAVKKALYFKLIHPATFRTLKDESKLYDEQITSDCDLLLVKKRLDESRFSRYGAAASKDKLLTKPPDAARIKEATSKLPKKGKVRQERETVSAEEFQKDLRRILVTLVESAQNILALNPEASKIFKEAQEIMNQESGTSTSDSAPADPEEDSVIVPEELVCHLTEMGFSRERAVSALSQSRLNVMSAMEWLLSHPETLHEDQSESKPDQQHQNIEAVSQESSDSTKHTSSESTFNKPDEKAPLDVRPKHSISSANSQPPATTPNTRRPSKAQTILESFRAYKRRKFKPKLSALHSLIDMGFDKTDVLEALRIADNSQEAACDWLLSDRSQGNSVDSLEDGIEPSSPLYQAIITNPVVQLGLSNPRCLLAFLHMLENGANAMDWLKDPDVGPILLQISRTYTAEKSELVYPGLTDE